MSENVRKVKTQEQTLKKHKETREIKKSGYFRYFENGYLNLQAWLLKFIELVIFLIYPKQ